MTGLALIRDMERAVREMGGLFHGLSLTAPRLTAEDAPRVVLREENDTFVVSAQLPGVDPEGLETTFHRGVLTLAGERRSAIPPGARCLRRERGTGAFRRVVALPDEVDAERVRAEFRDGVLTVNLPKAQSARPRRITVAAA